MITVLGLWILDFLLHIVTYHFKKKLLSEGNYGSTCLNIFVEKNTYFRKISNFLFLFLVSTLKK